MIGFHRKIVFSLTVISAVITILFGLFALINLLEIQFYYSFELSTIELIVFSSTIDSLIWAVSLVILTAIIISAIARKPRYRFIHLLFLAGLVLCFSFTLLFNSAFVNIMLISMGFTIAALSVYNSDAFAINRRLIISLVLLCTVCILLSIEVIALFSWLWNLPGNRVPFIDIGYWKIADFDLNLFNVFYPMISWLFLIFLSSCIWVPIAKVLLSKKGAKLLTTITVEDMGHKRKNFGKKGLIAGLLLISFLAALVSYYPSANLPSSILAGTDTTYYYEWVNEIQQKGPFAALERDRPFSSLLLCLVQSATGVATETVLRLAPVACAVSLSLAVFWFVMIGTKNQQLALLSSLFTVFSFQTTVSIFVYSLSNWIALIEMFLIFGLFLKISNKISVRGIGVFSLLGILLLLTHPYTWEVAFAIFSVYLFYSLLRKRKEDDAKIKQLIAFLTINLVFFFAYTLSSFGRGMADAGVAVLNYGMPAITLTNVLGIKEGIEIMAQNWVGGLFVNPFFVILGIVGLHILIVSHRAYSKLLFLWVLVPSISLLAFTPGSFIYYRLVYMIPFQIFAAAGLNLALDKLEDVCSFGPKKSFVFKLLVLAFVVVLLLNYSLRVSDLVPLHIISD